MNIESNIPLATGREIIVNPETEYLISDVEELVNKNARKFLNGAPYEIKVHGYRPELLNGTKPAGIDLLEADFLMDVGAFNREFTSMDLLFNFPVSRDGENPWNIAVKWSDGIQVRLASVGNKSILLVEDSKENGHTYHAETLHPEIMSHYIDNLGLPPSFFTNDIKELARDLNSCPELFLKQRASSFVDPYTRIELLHDAEMRADDGDDKQLVQELCINIDHYSRFDETHHNDDELQPVPYRQYRNMLRFLFDEETGLWKYRASYHGKLEANLLLDEEPVHKDPQLDIPSINLLRKAFEGLQI